MTITASHLYSYTQCPHRIWRDVYGPQEEKSEEDNPFLKMLWEKGLQHEQSVIETLEDFIDISQFPRQRQQEETLKAIESKVKYIYQGVIQYEDLLGIPDLLELQIDGSYIPIDIKSGIGYEETDDGDEKLKKHYAVQLGLYVEVLNSLGISHSHRAVVWNINKAQVNYDLDQPMGKRTTETFWEFYQLVKENVRLLMGNKKQNKPAIAGICKLCHWYESCKNWCLNNNDLTKVFYLGRSVRDVFNSELGINTVAQLSEQNIDEILEIKKSQKGSLKGLGEKRLTQFVKRAKILEKQGSPVLYDTIEFPKVDVELFFDIETDPTQDFVYLHGLYERKNGEMKFIPFVASEVTPEAEKQTWKQVLDYIFQYPKGSYAVYYYSPYEKTTYRYLQEKYPDVITGAELDAFFEDPNVIDLYFDVVFKSTDWPLSSYSIKEIAVYLGFKWRDESPSGALSIEWYNDYLKSGDKKTLQRILDYNEDDCIATMVVKDGIVNLSNNLSLNV